MGVGKLKAECEFYWKFSILWFKTRIGLINKVSFFISLFLIEPTLTSFDYFQLSFKQLELDSY